MTFKHFYVESILMEEFEQGIYNTVQRETVLPYFAKKMGFSNIADFFLDPKGPEVMKIFKQVVVDKFGVEDGRPNTENLHDDGVVKNIIQIMSQHPEIEPFLQSREMTLSK